MNKYVHTVIPMAWCSECGPGECAHTIRANESLIKSFYETKMAQQRKLPGLTGEPWRKYPHA